MHPSTPLDQDQLAVLALPDGASAAVLGAPGTGRTTTAVALVADRIRSGALAPEQVLLLAPRRPQAARLRDRLLVAVGRPVSGPLARTPASLAFDVARRDAVADGRPAPVLLAGGEQDRIVAQLLQESVAPWPERIGPDVRAMRAFRSELREVFARCGERGLEPAALAAVAAQAGRDDWAAAAVFWQEYLEVLPAVLEDAFDSTELVALATAAVEQGRPGDLAGALRLVVVDDLQDMGESVVGLLAALAARGCAIVAFGDPDVAADTFRGGEPDLLGRFEQRLGLPGALRLGLSRVHRHPQSIRRVVAQVTGRIGTALAGTQRTAAADPGGERVLSIAAKGPGELAVRIAHLLRDVHLHHGVDFGEQAVIVRSGALIEPLARALEIAGVPTTAAATGGIGTDERAPRALLDVVATALGLAPLTPESAAALVTGPFGGLDRLTLRRLRLALRVEELAGGGDRSAGALLVEALGAPGRLATIDAPAARRAARVAETLETVRSMDAGGASAEELLWHVWDRSGLAAVWRDRALGDGIASAEANRDLDGVVALFGAAARAAERNPTDPAGVFVSAQLAAEVADDVLAPRGLREGVLVTTPVGAVGLEFDTVVIAGLQDGVWPNLRPRGSLLGLNDLVARLDGRDLPAVRTDDRKAVLSDELRLFALAASRAQHRLVLAAVANDDESPSVLLGLADGPAPDVAGSAPNSLRPLVGLLRRTAVTGQPNERADAASALARLAAADVPCAAPASWWGLAPVSTEDPLVPDPETPVRVSPSKLERFEESALDWFVDRVSGGAPMLAGAIGTILHQVLETAAVPDEALLLAELEGRWRDLGFEADWVAARERRLADRMVGLIATYLRDRAAAGWTLLGGETEFEVQVGRALAKGSIDRVERDAGGSIEIVDLKTGAVSGMTKGQAVDHGQLGLYQLAVLLGAVPSATTDAPPAASLLYVKTGRGAPYKVFLRPPLDDAAAERMTERLVLAAEGMAAGIFVGPLEPDLRHGQSAYRPMLLRIAEVCGG